MFLENFKVDSREFQENLKEVQMAFQGTFKGVNESFMKVSSVFQENFKNFQECFIYVLFCNFVVAWHSSQLPE